MPDKNLKNFLYGREVKKAASGAWTNGHWLLFDKYITKAQRRRFTYYLTEGYSPNDREMITQATKDIQDEDLYIIKSDNKIQTLQPTKYRKFIMNVYKSEDLIIAFQANYIDYIFRIFNGSYLLTKSNTDPAIIIKDKGDQIVHIGFLMPMKV